MRTEIGKETPSGWTLLETTTLYYAITYLQVRDEKVNLFSVVAMYNNIATYSFSNTKLNVSNGAQKVDEK